MHTITRLALPAVACLLLLTGCKKQAAFLIVDANTNQPIPNALIDHNAIYDFTDPRGGNGYLKETLAVDADGWVELNKPQSVDSYVIRAGGYRVREVRMTEPGEMAEYMVLGGQQVKQWIEVEPRDEDEDIPTFIIPLDPN